MFFKLLGAVVIVVSTSIIGYYFSKIDKYRAEDLEELKRGISMLRGIISFSSVPLSEGFVDISQRLIGSVAEIFEETGLMLRGNHGETATEIWETVLCRNQKRTYFIGEDMDNIFAFGRCLGYIDKAQQLNNAEILIEYIKATNARLLEKNSREGKVYRSMGVLCGILIAVVLF